MKLASDILKELVRVRSDTGTHYECAMGQKIYEMIQEHPYFQEHVEQCGLWYNQDMLNRPVVWALRRGTSNRTVVLSAHYDAVEIDSYGVLKPYALDPDILKDKMLNSSVISDEMKKTIQNPGWMVGRGCADCKSGIAENLFILFNSSNSEGNILFTAVCDEENLSAGARASIGLFKYLKERFHLNYRFAVITEPDSYKNENDAFSMAEGCVGKFLPVVVARGIVSHGALMLYGLNSAYIISEVVRRMELNEKFHSCINNRHTHPATTLLMRDLKECYDISLPEYSAAAFNILYYRSECLSQYMQDIRRCCLEAADAAIARYCRTYEDMAECGAVCKADMLQLTPEVYTTEELKQLLRQRRPGFDAELRKIEAEIKNMMVDPKKTLQMLSVEYIRKLTALYESVNPVVVIGVAPPFYPAVANGGDYPDENRILNTLVMELNAEGYAPVFRDPYNAGPTDLCYMFVNDLQKNLEIMSNMCIPADIYDIDFRTLAKVGMPSILMGATGKDVHKVSERVWIDDVDHKVPHILEKILEIVFREG